MFQAPCQGERQTKSVYLRADGDRSEGSQTTGSGVLLTSDLKCLQSVYLIPRHNLTWQYSPDGCHQMAAS